MTTVADSPLVHVDNVVKNFQGPAGVITVLKGVKLDVRPGEFVGVRGPSGSGKSTLINMITGIDRPTSGSVRVAGQSIEKMSENQLARFRGKHIGVIFQFFQLLPTLTVIENVMLPMDFCNTYPSRERHDRAMALLEEVDMAQHAHKLPTATSGGQQQRVAIARALANDPPILVADEPTGNLDSGTGQEIMGLLKSLNEQDQLTIIMVTHDNNIARQADRIVKLTEGRIETLAKQAG